MFLVRLVAWLLVPVLWRAVAGSSSPAIASIEHGIVFVPLVLFPVASELVLALLDERGGARLVRWVEPAAAVLTVASFAATQGPVAAALVAPWLVVAVLASARVLPLALRRREVNLVAAHVFLVAGAVWLVLARAGAAPFSFPTTTVHLAALHFHFSGFVLQVVLAATARRLRNRGMTVVHRVVTASAIAGIPLIAIGNATASPAIKLVGVMAMVASTVALAPLAWGVSCVAPLLERRLLRASAAAIGVAMLLAASYGITEASGHPWLPIARMAQVHGLLNALGFALPALVGHARWIVKASDTPECRKYGHRSPALERQNLRCSFSPEGS